VRRRYLPRVIIPLLALLLAAAPVFAAGSSLLAGRTVVLDPGHGGDQDGACYFGVREAAANLAIALKLRAHLAAAGATVVLTRATDTLLAPPGADTADELQLRVDVARAAAADIFVSIHANAHPTKPETAGVITFRAPGRSYGLASAVQDAVIEETDAVDTGVRTAGFHVLRHSAVPACLVETGFLSNREEAARLASAPYQEKVAYGIYKGIVRYFLSL